MDTELRKDTKDYKNHEILNATNLLITTNTTNQECGYGYGTTKGYKRLQKLRNTKRY
jgi:hypothetical protein